MPHDAPASWNSSLLTPKRNSDGVTPNSGAKCRWGIVKIGDFQQVTRYNLKTVEDRCMVSIKI